MFRDSTIGKILPPIAAVLLIAPMACQGLDNDHSEPIKIEADRAVLNESQESSTYEGNVYLRQGTLQLRGDRMSIQLVNSEVDRITLSGQPARMQQRRENETEDRHAEAGSIEYSVAEARVVLTGNARVWQHDKKQFSSERIVFNLKDSSVIAGGKDSEDRVHITLQPKKSENSEPKITQ